MGERQFGSRRLVGEPGGSGGASAQAAIESLKVAERLDIVVAPYKGTAPGPEAFLTMVRDETERFRKRVSRLRSAEKS